MPDAVLARLRQRESQRRAFARKKFVRDLDQDAGAVARFRIATASAAMRQVDQDLNALTDDVVRLFAVQIDHEADAASVVLIGWDRTVPGLRGGAYLRLP